MPTGKKIACKKCGETGCYQIHWSTMVMEVRSKYDDLFGDKDDSRKYHVSERWSDGKITGGKCGNCGAELTAEEATEIYDEIDFDAPNTEITGGLSLGSM